MLPGTAPYGFRWEKAKDGKTYAVPVPEEQAICRRVAELYAQGYSVNQLRQYLAYKCKARNRNGREFGYTEVRNMALRGVKEQAHASEQATSPGQA